MFLIGWTVAFLALRVVSDGERLRVKGTLWGIEWPVKSACYRDWWVHTVHSAHEDLVIGV